MLALISRNCPLVSSGPSNPRRPFSYQQRSRAHEFGRLVWAILAFGWPVDCLSDWEPSESHAGQTRYSCPKGLPQQHPETPEMPRSPLQTSNLQALARGHAAHSNGSNGSQGSSQRAALGSAGGVTSASLGCRTPIFFFPFLILDLARATGLLQRSNLSVSFT